MFDLDKRRDQWDTMRKKDRAEIYRLMRGMADAIKELADEMESGGQMFWSAEIERVVRMHTDALSGAIHTELIHQIRYDEMVFVADMQRRGDSSGTEAAHIDAAIRILQERKSAL